MGGTVSPLKVYLEGASSRPLHQAPSFAVNHLHRSRDCVHVLRLQDFVMQVSTKRVPKAFRGFSTLVTVRLQTRP